MYVALNVVRLRAAGYHREVIEITDCWDFEASYQDVADRTQHSEEGIDRGHRSKWESSHDDVLMGLDGIIPYTDNAKPEGVRSHKHLSVGGCQIKALGMDGGDGQLSNTTIRSEALMRKRNFLKTSRSHHGTDEYNYIILNKKFELKRSSIEGVLAAACLSHPLFRNVVDAIESGIDVLKARRAITPNPARGKNTSMP
eukprot:1713893-Amphidinium_carterae.1